jgi:aarF domain-containing kinase
MMFSDGFYNADPHPGNFLVSLAPQTLHQPVLLDFGLTTSLTPELRRALAKLVCSGGT